MQSTYLQLRGFSEIGFALVSHRRPCNITKSQQKQQLWPSTSSATIQITYYKSQSRKYQVENDRDTLLRHSDDLKPYYHNEDLSQCYHNQNHPINETILLQWKTYLKTSRKTDKEILWPEIEDNIELGDSYWEKPRNDSAPLRRSTRNRKPNIRSCGQLLTTSASGFQSNLYYKPKIRCVKRK